jgi:serine/threonine-protein kinase RsbW
MYRSRDKRGRRLSKYWITSNAVVPSSHDSVLSFVERLSRLLKKNNFDDRDVIAIRLAVEEALVNAITHGNRLNPAKNVHVNFNIGPTEFSIRIEDEGDGFDQCIIPDPSVRDDLQDPKGRGLLLIQHSMDAVQFNARANVVTLVRKRS